MPSPLVVFGVSSPYAFDVVESVSRRGLEPVCVDNFGNADQCLPGLVALTDDTPRVPFTPGLSSAVHRRHSAAAERA